MISNMDGGNATTLVVTVGGSTQPIVTAIKQLRPSRCVFICSQQSRQFVDDTRKQTGLDEAQTDVLELKDPDDLGEVFVTCSEAIRKEQHEGRAVKADYTGGTKSMSAGLAYAASLLEVDVYVTTGVRHNAERVTHGETTKKVPRERIGPELAWVFELPERVKRFAFGESEEIIRQAMSRFGSDSTLDVVRELIGGFNLWDRFDHDQAKDFLKPYKSKLQRTWAALGGSIREREWLDKFTSAHEQPPKDERPDDLCRPYGYLVADLVRNAQRRAENKRFDDAVGRYYRALELWAQLRLAAEYDVLSSRVDAGWLRDTAPDLVRGESEGTLKLGLMDSWKLLAALDDPVGKQFQERERKIRSEIDARNNSLFAHGFKPVDEPTWDGVDQKIGGFIRESLSSVGFDLDVLFPQFPNDISWFERVAGR
jgi:CRISPR-associated protein (TIGR02710 family)